MAFVFTARDQTNGWETWISDGTTAGTRLLKNINTGTADSLPFEYIRVGNKLLFGATDATHGRELWLTDGTTAGTTLLKDINPGLASSTPSSVLLVYEMTALGNRVVFAANDGSMGSELWITDGTALGTKRVADINAGAGASNPTGFTVLGNKVIFAATDASHGRELWVSDGTAAGTTLLKDIQSGSGDSTPNEMVTVGNKVYFSAYDAAHGIELWVTDGTSAGTHMVKDIAQFASSSVGPSELTAFGNRVIFTDNVNGQDPAHPTVPQVFISDGTAGGTVQLSRFTSNDSISNPNSYVQVGNKVFFNARTTANGEELWVTDGTVAGTRMVKDLTPGTGHSFPGNLTAFGNKLLFLAQTPNLGGELWISDGTAAGTVLVKNISAAGSSFPNYITVIGNKAYFSADDSSHGAELWVTDGTAAGTHLVKDVAPGLPGSNATGFTLLPDALSPTNITLSAAAVQENKANGSVIGTLSTVDATVGDSFTYTLLNNAGGRFAIAGNQLKVANGLLLDFEQAASHAVQVKVTDTSGHSFIKNFNIAVQNVAPEVVTGNAANNVIVGGAGGDNFHGAAGVDTLKGGIGADLLHGGLGADLLYGGADADTFQFTALTDSVAATGIDRIFDFTRSQGDRIDVHLIDVVPGGADNAFTTLIGAAANFTAAGQYKVVQLTGAQATALGLATASGFNYRIDFNTDADAAAEMSVHVHSAAAFSAAANWFIL